MESKDPGMGLPTGAVTSTGTSTTAVTHNGNSETASVRPDATRPAHSCGNPNPGASLPTNSIILSPSHFNSTPSPYMPSNMSTSLVPVSTGGFSFIAASAASAGFEPVKKKRGRPRKYGPEGSLALTVAPLSSLAPSPSSPSQKRGRGRPPGSGKNQQLAALGELMLGSIGAGFTPHAITVATGEDIASRIMSFSQQGPRGICILSANGAISSVTLRQPSISGGIVTYEGRFEILSLSGSFLLSEFGGSRSRTGGLSVSLAGPDGRVVGGSVAGVLIAASPVQVIVGSFLSNNKKLPKPPKTEGSPGLSKLAPLNATTPNPLINAGYRGPNLSVGDLERKPILAESPVIERKPILAEIPVIAESPALNRSTTGGGIASSNVALFPKVHDQAMSPQPTVSENTTPSVPKVPDQAVPPQSIVSKTTTPNVTPTLIVHDQAKLPQSIVSKTTTPNVAPTLMVHDQAELPQSIVSKTTTPNIPPTPMVHDQAKPPQSIASQNTKEEKKNANNNPSSG
ncbi:hypothetical protein GOP47_0017387 [Adiantum capillus-veneris]|uniref:AT-hook motif nuclear-localized protein n=1 Tax=Adiantum capillus-veneris TaxID=13818 RepID=A0A9D4UF90_ADICA|nr:hypothetical protein GOP47_0017387 [Adiantum capillus-veneris]